MRLMVKEFFCLDATSSARVINIVNVYNILNYKKKIKNK